ncbi:MAG: CDP-alcohol phosphatidyltransferase family protein [Desulfuromonadaceae bacterium]
MNETNIRMPHRPENPLIVAGILLELRRISIGGLAVQIIAAIFLGLSWNWVAALQWILQAGLIWVLVLYETNRHLPLNCKSPGTAMYPHLGVANRLTITRGWLIAATGGFLFQEYPPGVVALVPAVLYAISAIIDRIDGYAARRSGQVSRMGAELDTVFDALGLAVAPLLAVWYGKIHWTYLSVSAAYYVFQLGLCYRRRKGLPVVKLKPKLSRRAIAGFQMGFIAIVLFPVFEPPATRIAAFVLMLPVLGGFLLDWFSVIGRISEHSRINQTTLKRGESLIGAVFQPSVRLLLAAAIMLWMFRSPLSIASPLPANPLSLYIILACGGLILLGILGRVFALVLVLLLGWHYTMHLPGVLDSVLLSATLWILVLGQGCFSLCSWDEAWVNRYDGA